MSRSASRPTSARETADLKTDTCEGCAFLAREDWPRGCAALLCTDPLKPMLGERRVLKICYTPNAPLPERPAWCVRKST